MTLANLTTIAALPTAGGVAASLRKDSAPAQRADNRPRFEIIDIVPSDIPSGHWRAVAEGVSAALVNLSGLESAASKPRPTLPAPWVPRLNCDDWHNPATGQTISGLELLQMRPGVRFA